MILPFHLLLWLGNGLYPGGRKLKNAAGFGLTLSSCNQQVNFGNEWNFSSVWSVFLMTLCSSKIIVFLIFMYAHVCCECVCVVAHVYMLGGWLFVSVHLSFVHFILWGRVSQSNRKLDDTVLWLSFIVACFVDFLFVPSKAGISGRLQCLFGLYLNSGG